MELIKSEAVRPEVFCKKNVLKSFTKFTGKASMPGSLFSDKVAGLGHRCFPLNFAKYLRTPFFVEPLR